MAIEHIPEALKKERRFACFNNSKIPMNALTGGYASSTNSNTWCRFEQALEGQCTFGFKGIGFMLGDGFYGVDIDTCRDPETGYVTEEAKEIIDGIDSYTEKSVSKYGVHIIAKENGLVLPFNKKKMKANGIIRPDIDYKTGKQSLDKDGAPKFKSPELEIYTKERFFILTGDAFGEPKAINERSDELKHLINKYGGDNEAADAEPIPQHPASAQHLSIEEACELDEVLKNYWQGGRPNGDESSDDMGFMGKLLYWLDADIDAARAAFLRSPYVAQKDAAHRKKLEREDYMEKTVRAAMPVTTAALDNAKWQGRSTQEKKDYAIDKNTESSAAIQEILQKLQPHTKYSYDDRGNGDAFADVYHRIARFNVTANEWYVYDGKVWIMDTGAMIVSRMAKQLRDDLFIYSISIENETQKTAYQKHIVKLGSRAVRDTMVKDARDKYCIRTTDLDKNANLFNCQNGTLHLKTFEFKEHDASDLLSKISNVCYDPEAKSDLWVKSINEILQNETAKINYLQKAIGYGVTADTSLETCFILFGASTRNGKSTIVESVMNMLGGSSGYAMQMKPESLAQRQNIDSRQASGDIARIASTRFLNVSEPQKKMIFDAALLKTLIGRDSIVARHLHEREFEFTPVFKLFMNTNFLPHIQDDTLFSSGRINVISFDKHFADHEQDKSLKDNLRKPENLSGIFNWCLDGLRKFYNEGLTPPSSIMEATAEYRKESDKVGKFLSECLEVVANENITAAMAYTVYEDWCKACGYGVENQSNFFAELRSKNLMSKTGTINGKTRQRVMKGFRITAEWTRAFPLV